MIFPHVFSSRRRQTLSISTVGTPLQRTLQIGCLFQWVCINSSILCVNPSLPRLTCRLSCKCGLTRVTISSLVRGSPRISSLFFPSWGNLPSWIGLPNSRRVTPSDAGGGGFSGSYRGTFFFLVFFGAAPVHGRGMVGGAKGRNAGSRIARGFTLGVSE